MVRVQIPVAATKGEHVSILTMVKLKLFKLITWQQKTSACSSSSLTGSAFEPAGDIADEESEIITSGSGLQNSMQDEDWEDLADTKV